MVLKRHKKQSNDQWRLLLLIDVFLLTSSSFDVATGIVPVSGNLGYMWVLGGKVLLYTRSIGIG